MPDAEPYPYMYVNADGSARELHPDERQYLETEFQGGDGAAPYIKSDYSERNAHSGDKDASGTIRPADCSSVGKWADSPPGQMCESRIV